MVNAEIKLDAAKEVLREEIRDFKDTHPGMVLAIFAFTENAELVYEGPVSDLDAVDFALQTLTPEDGTDIAAALDAAADYKATLTASALTQLVLISDGKSDRVNAMAAARRCLEHQLALSMLLIDPTEEGKSFARDVVRGVGGTYQAVVSRKGLREGTKRISESYTAGQARAERFLETARREAESVEEAMSECERLKSTSAYPGRIARGHDYVLRVYLHIASQLQEVMARLKTFGDQFGAYPRMGDAEPNQRIPIGTRLEVTPRINHIGVNPTQQGGDLDGLYRGVVVSYLLLRCRRGATAVQRVYRYHDEWVSAGADTGVHSGGNRYHASRAPHCGDDFPRIRFVFAEGRTDRSCVQGDVSDAWYSAFCGQGRHLKRTGVA